MPQSSLPVLIIGTGPSALLLGQYLLRASIPFRIFEKDQSLTQRAQGYRFRITGRGVTSCRNGLDANHFALLQATCANPPTSMKRIDAPTGNILPSGMSSKPNKASDEATEAPLVAERTMIRHVLFKGLEKYTIFGKQMIDYKEIEERSISATSSEVSADSDSSANPNSILVRFADGSTTAGSLLVGADGAFSKVRARLLPDTKLLDSSLRMAFGRTPLTEELEKVMGSDTYDKVVNGTCLISSPSTMFFMCESMRFGQRDAAKAMDADIAAEIPGDYVYWALALRSEQPEAQGVDWRAMSSSETADLTEKLTDNWNPALQLLLSRQDRTHTMPLFSGVMPLPMTKWRDQGDQNGPLVTLLGDAAHAMPPTAGAGATCALTDAAILGEALAKHGLTSHALEEYENQMFEYGSKAIEMGLKNGKMFLPGLRDMADMKPIERGHASKEQW